MKVEGRYSLLMPQSHGNPTSTIPKSAGQTQTSHFCWTDEYDSTESNGLRKSVLVCDPVRKLLIFKSHRSIS